MVSLAIISRGTFQAGNTLVALMVETQGVTANSTASGSGLLGLFEPGWMLLLGTGLVSLGWALRRHSRRQAKRKQLPD